jgi:hypothetical protein
MSDIVREGRIILSVELAIPNTSAANPIAAEIAAQQQQIADALGTQSNAAAEAAATNKALAVSQSEVAAATTEAYESMPPLTDAQLAALGVTEQATTAEVANTAAIEANTLAKAANVEATAEMGTATAATAVSSDAAAASSAGLLYDLGGLALGFLEVGIIVEAGVIIYESYGKIVEWVKDKINDTSDALKNHKEGIAEATGFLAEYNKQTQIELQTQRALAEVGDDNWKKEYALGHQLLSAQQDRGIANLALVPTGDAAVDQKNAAGAVIQLENQKAVIQEILKLKKQDAEESEKANKDQQRAIEQQEKKLEAAQKKYNTDRQRHIPNYNQRQRTLEEDQRELSQAQQNLNTLTGGKPADQALKELQDVNDRTIIEATNARDKLNDLLRTVIENIGTLQKAQAAAEQGARRSK